MGSRDKIYISKRDKVQKQYEELTAEAKSNKEPTKPFRFDRDVFLAAVVMGRNSKVSTPLAPGEGKERFTWSTMENDSNGLRILRAIALNETGDPQVLLDDDRVMRIAEGYANAGIDLLFKKIQGAGSSELMEAALFMDSIFRDLNLDKSEER